MSLTVTLREEKGKGANRRLRSQGLSSGIIYGTNGNTMISMRTDYGTRFIDAQKGQPRILEIQLEASGKTTTKSVLLQDYQFSNYGRKLIHMDFLEVTPETIVEVEVPIIVSQNCEAVKMGAMVQVIRRKIPVIGPMKAIPETLFADIDALAKGESYHVSSLELPEGVQAKTKGRDFTIITLGGKKGRQEDEDEETTEGAEGEGEAAAAAE